jgi:hypothetical protein
MQGSLPIIDVVLPPAAQAAIQAGNLNQALAGQHFPPAHQPAIGEVAAFAAKLSQSQRKMLLQALAHSLGASHEAKVSFSKRAVGYELGGIQLSVTDATVMEDGTVAPLAITFAYKS